MRASERDPGYFGWRVVAAGSVCLMLGFALYACTFSVFLKPLAAEFHWSRGTISTGFALSALAVAIFSPLTGQWMDRRSPRPALIFGVTASSVAFLCLGRVATVWQFDLLCFLLGCVGNNVQMGYTQLISAWFEGRRGLAMGAMLAGEGVGLIVFPPLAEQLVHMAGWRGAYGALAALMLVCSLPVTLLYGRGGHPSEQRVEKQAAGKGDLAHRLRSAPFWILMAVLFLGSISINGAMTQQIPMLTDRGLAAAAAAISVSVLGVCSLCSRLIAGWLLDRVNGPTVACILLLGAGSGIALLALAGTFTSACLAAALLGLGAGGTSSVTPYLLTRYFGTRGFATLYGFTWSIYAIAGGSGPMLLGFAYDATRSYVTVLLLLAGATVLGGFLVLLLPSTRAVAAEVPILAAIE